MGRVNESDIWTLFICVMGIVCLSFLSGVDNAMANADAAHKLAVFCQDAPGSMICVR